MGHQEVCKRAYSDKVPSDFVPLQLGDPAFDLGGRLVCAKAGDLILWDSRCIHCNTPGIVETQSTGGHAGDIDCMNFGSYDDASAQVELLRVVGYVCMTPAAWAPNDILVKRKDAFINKVGTNHWPHEYHPSE